MEHVSRIGGSEIASPAASPMEAEQPTVEAAPASQARPAGVGAGLGLKVEVGAASPEKLDAFVHGLQLKAEGLELAANLAHAEHDLMAWLIHNMGDIGHG
jgi:hypothetical protein